MRRLFYIPAYFGLVLLPVLLGAAEPSPRQMDRDTTHSGGERWAVGPDLPSADEKPKPRKIGVEPISIVVVSEPGGMKTVTIHFRWSIYKDASVEVRLVPDPVAEGTKVAPIYFHEQLKGKVRQQLYECLDHSDKGGRNHSFTKEKTVYKMIGRLNTLGNQGVHVQVYKEDTEPSKAPAAAYLQLDTWAVDKDTIALDMARDEFTQPGTLFVWFFRGDKVVWEDQIRWPGYK